MSHYFSSLPDDERRLMASVGGISRVLKHGPDNAIAPARAGFLARFDNEVDPDGTLSPDKRAQLSALALKLHMKKMALARAAATRKALNNRQAKQAPL